MSDPIKRLNVATPQGSAGSLWHESQFVFNYMNEATKSCEVSLTMPLRAQSYSSNALLPVFAMNRPEGALLTAISQRLAKHIRLDDMRHGFEDMAVLAGKLPDAQGRYKYEGKYEGIAAIIQAFCGTQAQQQTRRFFKYFTLSCMVRNGDAHLKNFGLTYTHPNDPQSIRLAPLYDVVTTAAYDHKNLRTGQRMADRTLALKLNKSNSYPTRKQLIAFGATCHEPHPEQVIKRIATAMTEALNANRQRFSTDFFQRLQQEWDDGRRAAADS